METTTKELEHPADIDTTISKLNEIIAWGISEKNRNAYFAALYRNITFRVKKGTELNDFEDPERMDRFVRIFAGYYIDAYEQFIKGVLPETNPWNFVFKQGKKKRSIVQHLLLGVNVHINYDLPNTCFRILPGPEMIQLSNDYFKINSILSSAVTQVEKQIAELSPLLAIAVWLFPRFERQILNFSLSVARAKSWECACQQAVSDNEERAGVRAASLAMAKELCKRILNPGIFASIFITLIGLTELRCVKRNVEVLSSKA